MKLPAILRKHPKPDDITPPRRTVADAVLRGLACTGLEGLEILSVHPVERDGPLGGRSCTIRGRYTLPETGEVSPITIAVYGDRPLQGNNFDWEDR